MPINPGVRLGPYEVVSPLGAGGMGEVYRARDTKLNRDVAIKVLSQNFTYDPERIARFEREAQLLAALNHPHIASIYGLEQSDGAQVLVMELVEGETLAQRLGAGVVAVPETLAIAGQIADALHAAHDRGIIHRDLKPANIALNTDGQVKVLDFGLAKAVGPAEAGHHDVANSPTLTLAATQAGVILGTAAYMAPEQAKGKAADKRSDIWAFGCVLYEMLTGRRAFDGDDASDTMAAVLRAEPDWRALPSDTPAAVGALLRRCLEKDRRARVVDAGAALFVLRELASLAPPANAPSPVRRRGRWKAAVAAAALLAAVTGAGVAAWVLAGETPAPLMFEIPTPPSASFWSIALSPDRQSIVYTALDEQNRERLWIRRLDSVVPQLLAGTEDAAMPFWSPDSRSVAFFSGQTIRRVDVAGGPAQTIARTTGGNPAGGTWNDADVILFSRAANAIFRVSAAGGQPEAVTVLDEAARETQHGFPVFLPGGDRFLFSRFASGQARLVVRDLRDGSETPLREGVNRTVYDPAGYVLFRAGGALMAQAFDAQASRLSGDAVPVADAVDADRQWVAMTATAGAIAYRGGASLERLQIGWLDRQGAAAGGRLGPPTRSFNPYVSADGTRVAVDHQGSGNSDVWVYDAQRGTGTRLTFHDGIDSDAVFSPDGRSVIFYSDRTPAGFYVRASNGAGAESLVAETGVATFPRDWSRDGRFVAYDRQNDIWILPMTGERKPFVYQASPEYAEGQAHFSPNGSWLAYGSAETGRAEVFVQDFPATGSKFQASTNGGAEPRWREDGRELYYLGADGQLMAVAVEYEPEFRLGAPRALFQTALLRLPGPARRYGVVDRGQRFMMNVAPEGESASAPITVVLNWAAKLPRR